jgi:hypothetical protein
MPASKILLIGAGFSRNMGAPLANEVASALMRTVEDDAYLRDLLTRHAKICLPASYSMFAPKC